MKLNRGLLIEAQLVSVKEHKSNGKSKCLQRCANTCPTRNFYYTHIMVFNATDKILAVRPGTRICKADMAFKDPVLTQKYNERVNKLENNTKIIKETIENKIEAENREKLWDKMEKNIKQTDKITKSPILNRKIKRLDKVK